MKQADIERAVTCSAWHDDLYLSDLVGLVLGLDKQALGIDRHYVTSR